MKQLPKGYYCLDMTKFPTLEEKKDAFMDFKALTGCSNKPLYKDTKVVRSTPSGRTGKNSSRTVEFYVDGSYDGNIYTEITDMLLNPYTEDIEL